MASPQVQIEAARAALIALHAAAGLAAGSQPRTALRALRAAEGLTRSAIAVLTAMKSTPEPKLQQPAAGDAAAKRQRKRRRKHKKAMAVDSVADDGLQQQNETPGATDAPTQGSLDAGGQAAAVAAADSTMVLAPVEMAVGHKMGDAITFRWHGKTLKGTIEDKCEDDEDEDWIVHVPAHGGKKQRAGKRSGGGSSSSYTVYTCTSKDVIAPGGKG